jgi:hypothetical protein
MRALSVVAAALAALLVSAKPEQVCLGGDVSLL